MAERSENVAQGRPDAYDQLLREIALAKENFETRLDAIDKATALLQSRADRVPQIETVAEQLHGLKALHSEKFASIATQFLERDTRTEQTSKDSKIAIDAALQAAKEAVGKTEISFTKQIDALAASMQIMVKGFDDKLDDIKTRVTTIESRTAGIQNNKIEARDDSKHLWSIAFGIGGFAVAAATLVSVFIK